MARARSRQATSAKKSPSKGPGDRWSALTWEDVEDWAGSRTVARGRSYQSGGRVRELGISEDGDLLATVIGTERYVTTVGLAAKRRQPTLESTCTCPVGFRCKHAVAVILDYLQAVAEGREVPVATEDDPRWATLDEEADFGDDREDDDLWGDDYEDEYEAPPRASRKRRGKAGAGASRTSWDDKIQQHLRGKSQGELADLVWSLARRFPDIYQEFRERISLQEGDVEQLLAEARSEIRRVTSEPGWRNGWSGEGYTPDYSKIRHRLERLLDLGHADEVVSLGRDLIREGLRQIGESHDEGETSMAFSACLPVVFQAVTRSSLSGPERLLFAIDAELADSYDSLGEGPGVVFEADYPPEDWSAVADALAGRLEATADSASRAEDDFYRRFQRDSITNQIAEALERAGRGDELRSVYESEARATWSYERLVAFLLHNGHLDDAERWAREGIAVTGEKYPGIAAHLAASLAELARKRKRWDVVAAHAAHKLFGDYPSPLAFDELMKAARKARVEEPVRAAALHFLETGVAPYKVVSPSTTEPKPRGTTGRRTRGKKAAEERPAASSSKPSTPRVKIDPAWPLPVPEELIPLMDRPGRYAEEPRPHLGVLLDMAIAAKRPDEVLRWYDKMRSAPRGPGYRDPAMAYADRVAAAVSAEYPERSLEIYLDALNAQLPHAQPSAYESAVGYLRKLRPLYEALGRADEWTALVARIREEYRRRPRFMELLDGLEGRTILQSTRSRRR